MKTLRTWDVPPDEYAELRARIMRRAEVVQMRPTAQEGSGGAEGPCWVLPIEMWDDGKGYKKVRWRMRTVYTHRAMYEIDVAAIPDGLILDHKCRVRRCCNPAHMEPVTTAENTARGNGKWVYAQKSDTCRSPETS